MQIFERRMAVMVVGLATALAGAEGTDASPPRARSRVPEPDSVAEIRRQVQTFTTSRAPTGRRERKQLETQRKELDGAYKDLIERFLGEDAFDVLRGDEVVSVSHRAQVRDALDEFAPHVDSRLGDLRAGIAGRFSDGRAYRHHLFNATLHPAGERRVGEIERAIDKLFDEAGREPTKYETSRVSPLPELRLAEGLSLEFGAHLDRDRARDVIHTYDAEQKAQVEAGMKARFEHDSHMLRISDALPWFDLRD